MIWADLRQRFSPTVVARSFGSLRNADFRRWSVVQFLSGSGGAASMVAIAWLVVELGGDGIALGIVTGSVMLPTLLLGSVAGALVDRFSRRSVLLISQSAQLVVAVLLTFVSFAGWVSLPWLFALSLAQGLAFAVDNPARQLLVLDLVGRERTTSAVSMNEVVINGSRIFGPAVAGVMLTAAGAGWCFVFNAVAFIPSVIVLVLLRIPAARPRHERSSALRTASPWRYAIGTAPIRATLALAIGAAAAYNIAVVMPLMASDVFDAGGGAYGAIAVAFGIGALPGALFSATGPIMPRSEEVRVLALAMAVAVVLTAFAPTLPLLLVAIAFVGATSMWFIARANAFVLLTTPLQMRGRVMGIWTMVLPGSTVLTGLLVGTLADAAGPRVAYAAVGAFIAAIAVWAWRALRTA